jgi:copper chaperone CopZ
MFKIFALSILSLSFATARAEDKTCQVKGMHCESCMQTVTEKVCNESKYSTCKVSLIDEKKELGQVHLITKDAQAKIDEKAIGEAIKDSGYSMEKCVQGKAKAKSTKG